MFDDCLILAGGSGTRLWPASTSDFPKQFLPADKKNSFLYLSIERALEIAQRVIIITGNKFISYVVSDTVNLSAEDKKRIIVIEEPEAKNTAPAIYCAAIFSLFSGQNRNMIVLTCDHIIKPLKTFKSNALLSLSYVKENNNLIVFGIKPTRPETGFGYIETENENKNIFNVKTFYEKPNSKNAAQYIMNNNFYWNSGMFAFNVNFLIKQYKYLSVNIYNSLKNLKNPQKSDYKVSKGIKVLTSWKGLKTAYKKCEKISFDYAITEKCKDVKMIKAEFDWIDIGNWEDYINLYEDNKQEKKQDVFYSDNEKCYVDSDIPVAIAGVDDLIVIIRNGKRGTPARALITRKGHTHKVRDIVEKIITSGRADLI